MAAVLIGVVDLPRDLTSRKTARLLAASAVTLSDEVSLHVAASALVDDLEDAAEEILRLTEKIRAAERQLKVLIAEISTDLLSVHGISSVVAAGLIGHAGNLVTAETPARSPPSAGPHPCHARVAAFAVRVNRGGVGS